MNNLLGVIKDYIVLSNGYILREGFPFTCITNPSNVYDSIIIKPHGKRSFSPRFPDFNHTIDEYVSFINKYGLEKAFIISDDIVFLDKCPTLKYLCIVPADSAGDEFDYSSLYNRSDLLYLKCSTEYGVDFKLHTSIDYSRISSPKMLVMAGQGHLNGNSLDRLKTLLASEIKEDNLYSLFGSEDLETLQIVNSSIRNLQGIEQSSAIRQVELHHNRFLEDISALKSVKSSLKVLCIKNSCRINDFSVLEELQNLEVLILYGNNSIPSLRFLEKLKKLRVFAFDMNVVDGNLFHALNIERVYCAKNRKHYNLKDKDLPKGNVPTDIGLLDIEEWRRF